MMTTALQEYSFISDADGLNISVLRCEPAGQPQGIVQLVHGMAEHKERYEDFMRFLAEHGYVSVLHDHRGHGKSVKEEADLGYMYNSGGAYLIDDIRQLNAQLHQEYPTMPVYMFGHSMGSLAVRAYLKRYDDTIDALIVCGSPSKNPAAGAGRLLARLLITAARSFRKWHLEKTATALLRNAARMSGCAPIWMLCVPMMRIRCAAIPLP